LLWTTAYLGILFLLSSHTVQNGNKIGHRKIAAGILFVDLLWLPILAKEDNSTLDKSLSFHRAVNLLVAYAMERLTQNRKYSKRVPNETKSHFAITERMIECIRLVAVQGIRKVRFVKVYQSFIVNASLLDDTKHFKSFQALLVCRREHRQCQCLLAAEISS
jgi:hypothetical protein